MAKNLNVSIIAGVVAVDGIVSTKHSKAYVAMVSSREDLPLSLRGATLGGEVLATVFVADNDDDLDALASSAQGELKEIMLPSDPSARAKLLADWVAKAARKNKKALVPFLLLPLAACGGGGDSDSPAAPVPTVLTGVLPALDILAINGDIDGSGITAINGTAEDVAAALARLSPAPTNFNSTLTGVASAADIAAIELANGTGTINGAGITEINGTAAAVVQALADLDTDPANFNSTLTGVASAADIAAIELANGTGSIDASSVATLTGSAAAVRAVLESSDVTGLGSVNVKITDTDVDAADLAAIASLTFGDVNVAGVTQVTGPKDDLLEVYGGDFIGLGNESVVVTDASINVADAETVLRFSTGSTTIPNITGTGKEFSKLSIGANDSVMKVTVLGSSVITEIDLRNIPLETEIVFVGRPGGETVLLPEGKTDGTTATYELDVALSSGSGNDKFVFYGGGDVGDKLNVTGNIAFASGTNTLMLVGTVDMTAVTVTSTILRFEGVQLQLSAGDTIAFTYEGVSYTATLGADVTASGVQLVVDAALGVKSGEVVASFEAGALNNLLLTVTDAAKPFITSGLFTNVDGGAAETFGFGNVSVVALQGSASVVTISTQTVNLISGLTGDPDPSNPTTLIVVNPQRDNDDTLLDDNSPAINLAGKISGVDTLQVQEDVVVILDSATLEGIGGVERLGSGQIQIIGPVTPGALAILGNLYTAPTVVSVELTASVGKVNNFLNDVDTVTATVTFSDDVDVTDSPQLTLNIGGTPVQASYTSGTGSNTLTFTYTILATQIDTNGISINANALSLNEGTIVDAADGLTPAILTYAAILDNLEYKVDTVDPDAPVITGFGEDTGSSGEDGITNDATPTLTITAEAGSTVEVFDGEDSLGFAVEGVGEDAGTFTFTPGEDLADGDYSFTAVATDVAGNESLASTATTVTVDTVAPTTTLTFGDISDDTGSSDSDFITSTASQTITATLSASLADGEKLYGSVDGSTTWTDITGKVSSTAVTWNGASLEEGTNTIKFEVRDTAGNAGPQASQSYTLDTSDPEPTITTVTYNNSTDTLIIVGANLDDGTYDPSKLRYAFGGVSRTFTVDEFSAQSLEGNTLSLTLTATASQAIETNEGFATTVDELDDGFTLLSGFLTDSAGNTSVEDTYVGLQFIWGGAPTSSNVFAGGSGDDVINGGAGSDVLTGGDGNDIINGRGGADRIIGGLGADTLTGGAGNDTFVFTGMNDSETGSLDVIKDFGNGADILDFSLLATQGTNGLTVDNVNQYEDLNALTAAASNAFDNGDYDFFVGKTETDAYVVWDANGDGQFDANVGDDMIVKLEGVMDLSAIGTSQILGADLVSV